MLIPLDDPIWSRLYGPYGVQPVAAELQKLLTQWNHETAKNLFWEWLHHQDDLYPVSYAALPWIVKLAPEDDSETPLFLSHFIFCAFSTGHCRETQHEKFRSLSLALQIHHREWHPAEQRLTTEDIGTLRELESWFSQNADQLAEFCVNKVTSEDIGMACHLCRGFAMTRGSGHLADSLNIYADEQTFTADYGEYGGEAEQPPLTPTDLQVIHALVNRLHEKNPDLAVELRRYAGEDIPRPDPNHLSLF